MRHPNPGATPSPGLRDRVVTYDSIKPKPGGVTCWRWQPTRSGRDDRNRGADRDPRDTRTATGGRRATPDRLTDHADG
jgi:hypothetical protein